jgi:hypothetical protein
LPGRNANAYSDPHAFTYRNRDGNSNTNSDRNGDGNGNGDNHTTSNSYAYADTIGNPASADAKAAAHAVPSANAVSEWVKKLKELKSNRELARPWPRIATRSVAGVATRKFLVL